MTPDELLSELTLEEKVRLLAGRDWWHTEAIERLGIPALHLSDGPVAVRGPRWVGATSVSFPSGTSIGATFDPEAAGLLGSALADECREKSVDVLLGPTVNLQRHPLGGRHFECYSEDPVLTAELAIAYISALQAEGVAATIKHFVANDTEFERHTISSDVDDETLRRAYLLPFEEAVSQAAPLALMTSYNRVNGTYAAEHRELVEGVLRGEWGFDGLVMSDWFGAQSTAASAIAGLDLEMPGPPSHYGEKLLEAVKNGEVSEETVDARARAVIELAEKLGRLDASAAPPGPRSDRAERRDIARELARRSFVLLSNRSVGGSGPLLPLKLSSGDHLAVIGPNAARTAVQGGGSAGVQPEMVVSALAGLRGAYEPTGVRVSHAVGCRSARNPAPLAGPFHLEYSAGGLNGEPVFAEDCVAQPFNWAGTPPDGTEALAGGFGVRATATLQPAETGNHRLYLSQIGTARLFLDGDLLLEGSKERGQRFHGLASAEVVAEVELEAGSRHEVVVEYESVAGRPLAGFFVGHEPPLAQDDELIAEAVRLAGEADAVVCVVGTSSEWETEGEDRASFELPGRQDELVESVLRANPKTVVVLNTGSPVAIDWCERAGALLQIWFGGERVGEALVDVLAGDSEPGGRLPHTMPARIEDTPAFASYPGEAGHAAYGEGLLIGYRHYAATGTTPRFWFGHGLSYATFELKALGVESDDESVTCRAVLANTSERAGAAVVQAYLSPVEPRPGEPPIVFGGSLRHRLEAGARTDLELPLARRRLSRLGLRGRYRLLLGQSADPAALQEAGEVRIEA